MELPDDSKKSEFQKFETKDKNQNGNPLASGFIIDFENFIDPTSSLKKLVREMKTEVNTGPYIIMDLALPRDLNLLVDGKEFDSEDNSKMAKILMSANEIIDMTKIGAKMGNSIVKCNPAVPVYRWFQAGNLILKKCGQKGRIIPFPIDQENEETGEKMTTFHVLQADVNEYKEYSGVMDYGIKVQGLKDGFDSSARFSYEILKRRGVTEINADAVDSIISHVMLKTAKMHGILILNAENEDLEMEKEDLMNNQIFF